MFEYFIVCVCCRLLAVTILAILVLLAGITVKRFGLGAKGWEQIPLISIWRFIGNFFAVSFELRVLSLLFTDL